MSEFDDIDIEDGVQVQLPPGVAPSLTGQYYYSHSICSGGLRVIGPIEDLRFPPRLVEEPRVEPEVRAPSTPKIRHLIMRVIPNWIRYRPLAWIFGLWDRDLVTPILLIFFGLTFGVCMAACTLKFPTLDGMVTPKRGGTRHNTTAH